MVLMLGRNSGGSLSLQQEEGRLLFKAGGRGEEEPQGNEVGWDCRVRPTLEAPLCIIIMWETHLEGDGQWRRSRSHGVLQTKQNKQKTRAIFPVGVGCATFGERLQTTVLPLDSPATQEGNGVQEVSLSHPHIRCPSLARLDMPCPR